MENSAELKINGNTYKLPIVEGSEQERGIDISTLRNQTGVSENEACCNEVCLQLVVVMRSLQGRQRLSSSPPGSCRGGGSCQADEPYGQACGGSRRRGRIRRVSPG